MINSSCKKPKTGSEKYWKMEGNWVPYAKETIPTKLKNPEQWKNEKWKGNGRKLSSLCKRNNSDKIKKSRTMEKWKMEGKWKEIEFLMQKKQFRQNLKIPNNKKMKNERKNGRKLSFLYKRNNSDKIKRFKTMKKWKILKNERKNGRKLPYVYKWNKLKNHDKLKNHRQWKSKILENVREVEEKPKKFNFLCKENNSHKKIKKCFKNLKMRKSSENSTR